MSDYRLDQEKMRGCPTLDELPSPETDKQGWPWTEGSKPLPARRKDGSVWPKISIVTPSYNQGRFLEGTIRSVLLQGYPNLEYVIIDGQSSDNSVDVIKRYEAWIDFWVSQPDQGQSHAINKGFSLCSGQFSNWQNSDDMFCQNAFQKFALQGELDLDSFYVGTCITINEEGEQTGRQKGGVHSIDELVRIPEVWRNGSSIPQSAVLFPLDRFREVGGVDIYNHCTMDYELWGKFLMTGMSVSYLDFDIGMFRVYNGQKVSYQKAITESMVANARELIDQQRSWPDKKKQDMVNNLESYAKVVRLGGAGRLTRFGLPEPIIAFLRMLKLNGRK